MKFLNILLIFFISGALYAQNDKPCGQLPVLKPDVKAVCHEDVQNILSHELPSIFKKKESYKASFKIILDCNGSIDMVIYKDGNLNTEQQIHFLNKINQLKKWTPAKENNNEVTSTIFLTININKGEVEYKFYN